MEKSALPIKPSSISDIIRRFFRTYTLHEDLMLDSSTKFDISAASLSKLTKTQVVFPVDAEDLIHRLQGLHVLTIFF